MLKSNREGRHDNPPKHLCNERDLCYDVMQEGNGILCINNNVKNNEKYAIFFCSGALYETDTLG
jgi:hypothetical protein